MEMAGVLLDVPFLERMSDELAGRLAELEPQIQEQVGYAFNVNSTQQLSDALFKRLGLNAAGRAPHRVRPLLHCGRRAGASWPGSIR